MCYCNVISMSLKSQDIDRENFCDARALLIFPHQIHVLGRKQIKRRLRHKTLNIIGIQLLIAQRGILGLAQAVVMAVMYARERILRTSAAALDEDADADALLDVEDILILAAVGCSFLLFAVAVQVENINFVECP